MEIQNCKVHKARRQCCQHIAGEKNCIIKVIQTRSNYDKIVSSTAKINHLLPGKVHSSYNETYGSLNSRSEERQ